MDSVKPVVDKINKTRIQPIAEPFRGIAHNRYDYRDAQDYEQAHISRGVNSDFRNAFPNF